MLIIGLTGSLATGKSTVAAMLAKKGAKVLNADNIARDLLKPRTPCFRRVVKAFGKEILKGGKVDRKKLAAVVFQSAAKRKKLESIIHPAVRKTIKAKLKKMNPKAIVVLDIPLLFESKAYGFVDATVVVSANQKQQVKRATKRLGISQQEALKRIRAQMPLAKKIRLSDYHIRNNGTRNQTQIKVGKLWQKLRQMTKNQKRTKK